MENKQVFKRRTHFSRASREKASCLFEAFSQQFDGLGLFYVPFQSRGRGKKEKEQFPSLVPGMSSYETQESQDVDLDVGNAPDSKSLSTTAVHFDIFSHASDVESESEESVHSTSKTSC